MVKNGIQAKKHLGQNFLRNQDILSKIVGDAPLHDVHIVEVGPGPGDLTNAILEKHPKSLSLVELDTDMIPLLQIRFRGSNIHLYHADVLKTDILIGETTTNSKNEVSVMEGKNILLPNYQVYGNIPYYITSPILHHFLYGVSLLPEKITFTMQKEVAERILARNNKHSILSISCQLVADIEKICDIHPNNFTPVPKVWSTCLSFHIKKNISQEKNKHIMKIVEKGFAQKRKKLITNLQNLYEKDSLMEIFHSLGLSETVRAEDLTIAQWQGITERLAK